MVIEVRCYNAQRFGSTDDLDISNSVDFIKGQNFTYNGRSTLFNRLIDELVAVYLGTSHGYEHTALRDFSAVKDNILHFYFHVPIGRNERNFIQYVLQYPHYPNTTFMIPFWGMEAPADKDWFLTLPCPVYCTLNPLFSNIYSASRNVIPVTSGTTCKSSTLLAFQLILWSTKLDFTHFSSPSYWLDRPNSLQISCSSSAIPAWIKGKSSCGRSFDFFSEGKASSPWFNSRSCE